MIGHVYRIVHLESELCYIGSTCNEPRKRWQYHKGIYKKWLNGKASGVAIYPYFEKFGIQQFKLILVKSYEVEDRAHLRAFEQLYINRFRKTCVNKNCSFGINKLYQKQWREANKDSIHEKKKQYYQTNKASITEKTKVYYHNNIGIIAEYNKQYYQANKNIINKHKKEYYQKNKDSIKAHKKEKFNCECGGTYTNTHKARHLKTNRHIQYFQVS